MAERESNKINLPTNTTDIEMLHNYLRAIKNKGTVSVLEEQDLFAQVKRESSRKTTENPATDTHTKKTLKLYGLIKVDENDESFSVTPLGDELIDYYEKTAEYSEIDRVKLMLKIFFSWNQVDDKNGRNIHPGLVIVKLLCDPALDYRLSNHEITIFTRNPSYLTDGQYDEIKREILTFRENKTLISADCIKNKTDIFMTTFVNNWSFMMKFPENKTLDKKQQDLLQKDLFDAQEEENEVAEDNKGSKCCINHYCLTALAAYVAHIYLRELGVDWLVPKESFADVKQKIYYGAPGTGKSFKIDDPENGWGLAIVDTKCKFRTTFHPDYDYAQFVGAYKPRAIPIKSQDDKKTVDDSHGRSNHKMTVITYEFIPQVFAKAYVTAWVEYLKATSCNSDATGEKVYLVIEEINRGNCAQIFGDIFQLLDRKNGHSAYPIDVDSDFAEYIEKQLTETGDDNGNERESNYWDRYKAKIQEWNRVNNGDQVAVTNDKEFCKVALPPNLVILATMNTSDQSLFPMDSAFKRRFDWEYVPIKYVRDKTCGKNWNANTFEIEVGSSKYNWLAFLKEVNANISKVTSSEDKQMGEFFIKPKNGTDITFEDFRSKVLFYLWDSVYKDEVDNNDAIVFRPQENGVEEKLTFQKLFEGDKPQQKDRVEKIIKWVIYRGQAPETPHAQGNQDGDAAAAEPDGNNREGQA